MKKKSRIIGLVLSLACLVTSFSACGTEKLTDASNSSAAATSTATTASKDDAKDFVTIVIGNWPKETEVQKRELWNNFAKKVQEKYPNIIVKGEEYGYAPDTFLAKAAANQLPNLYTTFFTEPQNIIKSGYAKDITEYAKQNGYIDAMNDQIKDIVSNDGKCYGIPYVAYTMGMWYNVGLFKKAGLVDKNNVPLYPKTYDELIQTAVTIKNKTGAAGFIMPTRGKIGGWFFLNLAWSYGTEFQKKVDGKWVASFDSAECAAALQYIKDLKWKYNVLPENNLVGIDDIFKAFAADQAAMSFGIDAHKNEPMKNYSMNKDNLSMGPVPKGPAGRYAQLGGSTWMVSTSTTDKQTDAIFKWLEVAGYSPKVTPESLQSIENDLKAQVADNNNGIVTPTVPFSIWKNADILTETNKLRAKYTNVKPELWAGIAADDVKIKPEYSVSSQSMYELIDTAIQKVLLDKNADPKAILSDLNKKFQTTYLDKVNK